MVPILVLIISLFFVNCSASEIRLPAIFAIPGQNGRGSEKDYLKNLLGGENQKIKDKFLFTHVSTPIFSPDLGQSACLGYLRTALDNDTNDLVLIHATSQGTATALNYLADGSKKDRIKCVILEAVLASGNSALYHTVNGPLMDGLQSVAQLPLARYWIPYCAKSMFYFYNPAGMQPIKSIETVSQDLVTILVHSKNDMQLPFYDACALYYRLCARGNKNIYFIQKEGDIHIDILNQPDDRSVIQSILKKHALIDYPDFTVDEAVLKPCQPDHTQFKIHYDALIAREKTYERISQGLQAAAAIGFAYVACQTLQSYYQQ